MFCRTFAKLSPASIEALKKNPKKFLFLGAPGVGKGTYATRLCEDTGLVHISTGMLLREEVAHGTSIGKTAKEYMDKGDLVPSALVDDMVKERVFKILKDGGGFVMDGYPRNLEQVRTVSSYTTIDHVVKLTQPYDVIINKISGRRSCSNCGESYNVATIEMGGITMPPLVPEVEGTCDHCGATGISLLQRDDDKEEVVRHRLELYDQVTAPIIAEYEKENTICTFDILGGTKKFYPKFLDFLNDTVHA
eukprot:TRINITY_DN624_c1_g2_i1.p1 TRINITY_DN624_c1_g2~~TRINITY_DN624_c1_g2_i1.p1  ORF type:complete len:274 (+),score=62.35 TRINITY_DN624_c1_g2_i1:76-822(+)